MDKLIYIDFPKERLKIKSLFKKEQALEEIRLQSTEKAALPVVTETYTELYFPQAPQHRPYVFSSIVLSADGKMAFHDNAAGPLIAKNNYLDPDGALADFWVLNVLRAYSDGVIIGAKTLQHEQVTSHVFDKELVAERKKYLGKENQPHGIIVSFDATDIPFDHMVFDVDESEKYKLIIATSPEGERYIKEKSPLKHVFVGPFKTREDVDAYQFDSLDKDYRTVPVIITGEGSMPDSDIFLYVLRKLGLERVCIESPTYNAHLMHQGCMDEYFINYSMVYAGGSITPGYSVPFGHTEHPHAELLSLGMHKDSFMFTRQKLRYGVTSSVDLSVYKY